MGEVSEIINVSASEEPGAEQQATFNIPAIMAKATDTPGAAYTGIRAKLFNNTTAGLADHAAQWGSVSDTQAAADIGKLQRPEVEKFYTIKRGTPVAVEKKITFSKAMVDGDSLIGVVNNQTIEVDYATSMSATLTAIAAALAGLVGVATGTVDGTDAIDLVADLNWYLDISLSVDGDDPPTIATSVTEEGRSIADDIADALAEEGTNEWYALAPVETDIGLILSGARKIEGTNKLFLFQTNEAGVKDVADTTNVGVWIKALGYRQSIGCWRHVTTDYWNVALAFWWLANEPGSTMVANTQLEGVVGTTAASLSASQKAVVEGRGLNTYTKFTNSTNLIRPGIRTDGQPADATRDLHDVANYASEIIFDYFKNTAKPSADEDGQVEFRELLDRVLEYALDKNIALANAPSSITPPVIEGRSYKGAKIKFKLDKGVIDAELNIVGGL